MLWFLMGAATLGAQVQDAGPALQVVPAKVYKVVETGRQKLESWTFNLVILDPEHQALRPVSAELSLFAGKTLIEHVELRGKALEALSAQSYALPRDAPPSSLRHRFHLDEAVDLRLRFSKPQAWAIDRVEVILSTATPNGKFLQLKVEVPVSAYHQRVSLAFPFKGPGIVTQGPISDGGHAGYSNQFALDVIGLTENYAPQVDGRDENVSYAGYGREILAPADAVVRYARNDVPDNPKPEQQDPALLDRQHDAPFAIAGNCVVLDFGHGEYLALMHMAMGSLKVREGQKVKRGDVLGRLGNSGDSFGPHLHLQLQESPDLFAAPSVPIHFDNVGARDLVRGGYFSATW